MKNKNSDGAEKKKKKKPKFEDDGRTVVDMNIEGTPWYKGKNYDPDKIPKLTFKERWAVFKGMFFAMLPPLLCTIAGMSVVAILLWLWLK